MPSSPTRFLFPRPLPHVDPHRHRNLLQRALVAVASSRAVQRLSLTTVWHKTAWKIEPHLQRLTGGRLSTAVGLPSALLETRGARTGRWRRHGVIYFHDGEVVTIVASQAGAPGNPAWYHNLLANPDVFFNGQPFTAHEVEGETARQRLWELADAVYPAFADYRSSAAEHGRTVPILQLVPRLGDDDDGEASTT